MKAFRYTFFGPFVEIVGGNGFIETPRNTAAHLAVRRRASNLRFELVASLFRQPSDAAFLIYQNFPGPIADLPLAKLAIVW